MLSECTFFAAERISDLLSLETEFDHDTKDGIEMLLRELLRMHNYVRDLESKEQEQQLERRFSVEIGSIVDKAEHILDGFVCGKNPPSPRAYATICDLLKRIDGLYAALSSNPSFNINTGNNVNYGREQITGNVSVYIGPNTPPLFRRVPKQQSYRHVQDCDIVGFLLEIQPLRSRLMQDEQTRVVGIVGMGGSGKTTLAKHLYHDPDIKKHFTCQVWVCVSQSWNKRDILYEILRQTKGATKGKEAVQNWSDQEFVEVLYDFLSMQLYLVILDDIWGVDAWNDISPAFPANKGSKVLVTTRNEGVPKLVHPAFFVLEPKPLDDYYSYELFRKRTFIDWNPTSVIENLGKDMALKCKGLPLAITALAGALRVNKALGHWRRIRETLTQSIMKLEDSTSHGVVKEVLALSYHDLPYHLKPCFLYLGIFPEDYEIRTGMLMKMWTAECLITHDPLSEEEKMLVAEEYVDELTQRYVIQVVNRNYIGQVKTFKIHDLIREMCLEKAKEKAVLEESLRVVLSFPSTSLSQSQQQCRERLNSIVHPAKSLHLRSLIFIHSLYEECLEVNMRLVCEKFKFLRVLILWGIGTYDYTLPEGLGSLVHLRYLGLRASDIEALPESIGNLQNLLTLDFRSFYADGGPPNNLYKLKRLRHLYLPVDYLEEEPDKWEALRLDKLENLQTLWYVRGGDWMLSEMAGLSRTLQKLCIVKIKNDEQLEAVFRSPSAMIGNLQTLKLDWSSHNAELRNMEIFKQCENLHKLVLRGKIRESESMPLVFPPNLIKLELQETELEATDLMGLIGNSLSCLKSLTLGRDSYKGAELTCNVDSFPELEQLKLEELTNLRFWNVERGAMPCLKDLTFTSCTNLFRFPKGNSFVSKIVQVNSWNMSSRFEVSLQLWREQHADNIQDSLSMNSQCEQRTSEENLEQGTDVVETIASPLKGFSRRIIQPLYMAGTIFFAILVAFIGIWKSQQGERSINSSYAD